MKHLLSTTLTLLALFTLIACTSKSSSEGLSETVQPPLESTVHLGTEPLYRELDVDYKLPDKLPSELAEQIKNRKKSVFVELTDAGKSLFYSWLDEPDSEMDERVSGIVRETLMKGIPKTIPEFISKEDVRYEIAFLFDYLKCVYSGYGYFGGDAVFLPVKETILSELDTSVSNDEISRGDYESLLARHIYPLVTDTHFTIGEYVEGHSLMKAKRLYAYSEELIFQKEGSSFKTILDGVEHTLVSIDGAEPGQYVKATILEDGSFGYVLGESQSSADISGMDASEWEKSLNILLKNRSEEKHTNVTLRLCEKLDRGENPPIYRSYEKNGVMVMENTLLYPDNSPDLLNMNDVSETAKFKNQKTVILDVIGHNGGNDYHVYEWLQTFLGGTQLPNIIMANKNTKTTNALNMYIDSYPSSEAVGSWNVNHFPSSSNLKNDTVTFLLTGRNGSSGEMWPSILSQANNVIMVGTNSVGGLQFANSVQFYLPYSNLPFQCGVSLSLINKDFTPFECVGYEPDLWVNPSQALDRVSKFIEKYELN